jgi:hypothetical protein
LRFLLELCSFSSQRISEDVIARDETFYLLSLLSHINAYVTRIEHAFFPGEKKSTTPKRKEGKKYNKRKQRRTAEALVNTLDELSA